jgi:nitrite reductase/ring-hydroxylating ferredoxin subunit
MRSSEVISLRALIAAAVTLAVVAVACGTSVFDLTVGDCFNDPEDGAFEVQTVEMVECSEFHDNEVFASIIYGAADLYPGELQMFDFASEACLSHFEAFVGADYVTSTLEYSYLTPTQDSWDEGDREIICFLYDARFSKLTGSMAGTGI